MSFSLTRLARVALLLWILSRLGQAAWLSANPQPNAALGAVSFLALLAVFSPFFYNWLRGRTIEDDETLFLGELSALLRRELPLDRSLEALALSRRGQLAHRFAPFTAILAEVALKTQRGATLSVALGEVREIPRHWATVIGQAESRGDLPETLEGLAELESTRMRMPILSLLRFQILAVLLLGICLFLSRYIMPSFLAIMGPLGVGLSWQSRLLVGFQPGLLSNGLGILLGATVLLLVLSVPFPGLRGTIRQLGYFVPGFRRVFKTEQQARAMRAMAVATRLGLPLGEVLATARGSVAIGSYRKALGAPDGTSLSEVLAARPDLFEPQTAWLCRQGERLGELPEALSSLADNLRLRHRQQVQELTVSLDTAILIGLGVAVGVAMVGMLRPYIDLIDHIVTGVLP
jgi:type II secretory pathway component PulF